MVPHRFQGPITVANVEQYLLGLPIGMDIQKLRATR